MKETEPLINYFKAEKSESLLFMAIGLLAIIISLILIFKFKDNIYKGIAIPLIIIGIIQLIVGGTVYFRTDAQVRELTQVYQENKAALKDLETPRMETVMKSFNTYKIIEAVIIVVGIILLFGIKDKSLWLGIGIGMVTQGALMIILDIFAELRALNYIEWLADL